VISTVAFDIPSEIWRCWIRICLVKGTLLKSAISGGCVGLAGLQRTSPGLEVEPLEIILGSAVSIIEKLRQVILNPPTTTKSGLSSINPNPSRLRLDVALCASRIR